jgi:hypothetical protein
MEGVGGVYGDEYLLCGTVANSFVSLPQCLISIRFACPRCPFSSFSIRRFLPCVEIPATGLVVTERNARDNIFMCGIGIINTNVSLVRNVVVYLAVSLFRRSSALRFDLFPFLSALSGLC